MKLRRVHITPPQPSPVHRQSDCPAYTDPQTGEQYYRINTLETITMVAMAIVLYIVHTLIIVTLTLLIYTQKLKDMNTTQKTVYISGPITNIPHGNVTTFREATKTIRNMGHIAKNPHEFCADLPKTTPWETYMRRCLQQLMDCTDIILLPGWENSDGASLEQLNASIIGITIHIGVQEFQQSQKEQNSRSI